MRIKVKEIKSRPEEYIGKHITIKGWVRTVRTQKNFSFVELNDGSTLSSFQIIVDRVLPDYEQIMEKVTTGAAVAASGQVAKSPAQGQELELKADVLEVIGLCNPISYALQKNAIHLSFCAALPT